MKNLSESLEKYLIAVSELSKENDSIIVKDVANYLGIGGPSTADAIRTLTQRGFLNYVPYGTISLTQSGIDAVELKAYRHEVISSFLNKVLGIDKESSDSNATAIEYSMTEDVLGKLVHFLDFMGQCTCKEPKWMNSCRHSLVNGYVSDKCKACANEGAECGSCCGGCER